MVDVYKNTIITLNTKFNHRYEQADAKIKNSESGGQKI